MAGHVGMEGRRQALFPTTANANLLLFVRLGTRGDVGQGERGLASANIVYRPERESWLVVWSCLLPISFHGARVVLQVVFGRMTT